MFIVPLRPTDAIRKWDEIEPVLKPAMTFEDGKYDLDDVWQMIKDEKAHCWIAFDGETIYGAAITQIVDYPKKSMLLVLCLAGKDFHLWDNIVKDFFVPYAREARCAGIEFLGRKGWVKRAAKLGFKPVHYVYELSLGGR